MMESSALQQPDTLHIICGFLPSGSLPKLARVSRTLHHLVLPYIWKKLDQRTIACLTREIRLTQQLTGHFKLHASLVRDFTLDFYRERRFRQSLISALNEIVAYSSPTESVLPNLRRFRICASEAVDLTYTHYFLGPSLYHLEIGCGGFNNQIMDDGYSEKVINELLLAIRERCTSLHTLSFGGMPWLRDLPEMERLLDSLPTVTTYYGDGVALSPRILTALCRSTNIRRLKMHILPSQYDVFDPWGDLPLDGVYTDAAPLLESIERSVSDRSFLSMRHIDLNCDVVVASTFLGRLRSNLQSVTLHCSNRRSLIPQQDIHGLLQNITRFSHSLQDMDLTFIESSDPLLRRSQPVSWQTFAPLLQCSEIQRFNLVYDTSDDFDFSRSYLSDITRSWRNLESFVLDWDPPARHRTKGVHHTGLHDPRGLHLRDLLLFASNCPRLHTLLVSWLDASGNLEDPKDLPTVAWPLMLGVGYGQMESVPDVAAFLRKVRPGVRVECRPSYGLEGPRIAWRKVQELLDMPSSMLSGARLA
ncbi:hypothetical protein CALCODRAFT_503574 [Calocera cornea HHB12733]|uniref:F-box domain-containing protein n=1 Tax=Calocera cornea HHB12733 TaxID=1353952 RepID=A0A165CU43_9BASI|nr:hypothetical protein CALCODRAFT_503574 [Calocera cornea HHB12733]